MTDDSQLPNALPSPNGTSGLTGDRPLLGKRAVVTGSSRGIGKGIALKLAEAGADVMINCYRQREEAESVVESCRALGVRSDVVLADVSDQADVEELVDSTVEKLGGIDIAVSNAAYSDRHLMIESNLDEFRRTIDISMWGAFYFIRRAAERMVEAGEGGNMVVISSPHAHEPMPGAMAYNMAKAANDQMARTAAVELAHHRIRVNIIHPGWIDTPGERKFFSEETLAQRGAALPWGRLGKPSEIGRGVVFLCDPASQYITGSTLTIDGGIQLPFDQMFRVEEASDQAS